MLITTLEGPTASHALPHDMPLLNHDAILELEDSVAPTTPGPSNREVVLCQSHKGYPSLVKRRRITELNSERGLLLLEVQNRVCEFARCLGSGP